MIHVSSIGGVSNIILLHQISVVSSWAVHRRSTTCRRRSTAAVDNCCKLHLKLAQQYRLGPQPVASDPAGTVELRWFGSCVGRT